MKKLVLSLGLLLASQLAFASADYQAVVICKNDAKRPTDGHSKQFEIYWDHQTKEGFVASEYVFYRSSAMFTGREAYSVSVYLEGEKMVADFRTANLTAINIPKQGHSVPLTWRGEKYTCAAIWDI